MSTQTILITGANRGIGLSLAKLYAQRANTTVIGACRNPKKDGEELQKNKCKVVELDVSSDESCATLPTRLKELGVTELNLLINNAGIGIFDNLESTTLIEAVRQQFETNALGPLKVTKAVIPLLKEGAKKNPAKVINVSSRMGSIADNTSGGSYGYRVSKAAENMISVNLAHDLAPHNIVSLVVHPGYIQTNMTSYSGEMKPDECAARLSKVIDAAKKEDAYKFWHRDGTVLPW